MLKVEPLYYLNMVYRFSSIRLAAENIPVSPSTISASLHKLEHDLGIPLLIRTYRGVELTETAKKIAVMTNDILMKLEEIESISVSAKRGNQDTCIDNKLTVYMARGYYQGDLAHIMQSFSRFGFDANFPDVSCSSDEHLKLVKKDCDTISLSFFTEPIDNAFLSHPNVSYLKVKTLKPQVVCAKNYPLIAPDKKYLTPKEVLNLPLLRFTEGYDQAMAIFEMLEHYGKVNIVGNFSNITVMQAMMLNHKGASVGTNLTLYYDDLEIANMRFIPIKIDQMLSFAICHNNKLPAHKLDILKKMVYDIV